MRRQMLYQYSFSWYWIKTQMLNTPHILNKTYCVDMMKILMLILIKILWWEDRCCIGIRLHYTEQNTYAEHTTYTEQNILCEHEIRLAIVYMLAYIYTKQNTMSVCKRENRLATICMIKSALASNVHIQIYSRKRKGGCENRLASV